MSSLRNAIPQRPYRERAQPHARNRHGLLEKHKDYSARARDYNAKKARLKILRQKASERNEDEFHFAMMSSKSKDGVKTADRGNKPLSNEVVKLLKTQDAGYLRTMRLRTKKERERLESEIQIIDQNSGGAAKLRALKDGHADTTQGRHTIFVDDEAEQEEFDPKEWFHTDREGLNKTYNRPRRIDGKLDDSSLEPDLDKSDQDNKQDRSDAKDLKEQGAAQNRRQRSQEQIKAKLEALKTREAELLVAEQELDLQRAKMNNAVGGVNKHGVKFKVRERKR